MKRTVWALGLCLCLLLSGCSAGLEGKHIWTQVHSIPQRPESNQQISAASYAQLYAALVRLVETGTTQATISVARYNKEEIEKDIPTAIEALRRGNPIAAYAVEQIHYTLGTSGGEQVLALEISYLHGQSEIKKIKTVADDAQAEAAVETALKSCESGIVLKVQDFQQTDFTQFVEDYAMEHPEQLMELPQVTVNIYPETGKTRVVELKFLYQTSRDSLKAMQLHVADLFKSAELFASGDRTEQERFQRLYTWLMETNEYTIQTSITPTYSLLMYATGDSRAFATVYAALCRQMDLECLTVSGTKNGESWCWNLVQIDGLYYHVDLLRSSQDGAFSTYVDSQMAEYVWDYNAYPLSPDPVEEEPQLVETEE